jgi:molecular chaperone GrpE
MKKTETARQKSADDHAGSKAAQPASSAPAPSDSSETALPVEPGTLTLEQLETLKARASKADEYWDRLLRTTADFENSRKRAARERQEAVKFANESLIQKILPVLDNLEMAQAAAQPGEVGSLQSLQTGIAMVQQGLKNILAEAGLEEVDASGKLFDPNLHEAVSQQESADVPEGHVVHQLRKGYRLRERLLRPASVVVAKKPASGSAD